MTFNPGDFVTNNAMPGGLGKVHSVSDHGVAVQWLQDSAPALMASRSSLRRLGVALPSVPSMTMEEIKTNLITMIEEDWLDADHAEAVFDLFGMEVPTRRISVSLIMDIEAEVPIYEADAVEGDWHGITINVSHDSYGDVEYEIENMRRY